MTNYPKTIFFTLLTLGSQVAWANVPVVSLNGDGNTVDETSTTTYGEAPKLSTEERLAVLERQMANMAKQNSQSKLSNLQQQIDQLQGKVDELSHQNQALSDQMKQQYQDLNDRLNTMTAANTAAAKTPVMAEVTDTTKAKPAKSKAKPTSDTSAVATPAGNNDDATVNNDAEAAAYQKGFNLLKKGDYVRAAPAFENFLKNYPTGPHAPNAHFWLGEIHLAQNQADAAAVEYQRVINDFPNSDKVQMALLKLGVAYHDQGDLCKAKSTFEKVMKQYPKTTAANMAKKALQDIPSPCSATHKTN